MPDSPLEIADSLVYRRLFSPSKTAVLSFFILLSVQALLAICAIYIFSIEEEGELLGILILILLTSFTFALIEYSSTYIRIRYKTLIAVQDGKLHVRRMINKRKKKSLKSILATPLLKPKEINHEDVHVELSECRYYRGFSFHDYLLWMFSPRPAVIISWPPFTKQDRVACALTDKKRKKWLEYLRESEAELEHDKLVHEREIITSVYLGMAMIGFLVCLLLNFLFRILLDQFDMSAKYASLSPILGILWGALCGQLIGNSICFQKISKEVYNKLILIAVGISLFWFGPVFAISMEEHDPDILASAFYLLVVSLLGYCCMIYSRKWTLEKEKTFESGITETIE